MRLRAILGLTALCLAVAAGPGRAGLDEGLGAFLREDYVAALKELQPLAYQGHAIAQVMLGAMYDEGLGVPLDFKEAVKWYRLAAGQGNPDAQNNLGAKYAKGEGVPQDYKESVKWYRLAAIQGHANGQYNLGNMYDAGLGVPQDYKEAVKWYRLAAGQGHASAQNNLGTMFVHGSGVVAANRVAAYALFNLSAANDPSSGNKAMANRNKLAESMSFREVEAAQDLTRELAKPGNFLKALDRYVKQP